VYRSFFFEKKGIGGTASLYLKRRKRKKEKRKKVRETSVEEVIFISEQ